MALHAICRHALIIIKNLTIPPERSFCSDITASVAVLHPNFNAVFEEPASLGTVLSYLVSDDRAGSRGSQGGCRRASLIPFLPWREKDSCMVILKAAQRSAESGQVFELSSAGLGEGEVLCGYEVALLVFLSQATCLLGHSREYEWLNRKDLCHKLHQQLSGMHR